MLMVVAIHFTLHGGIFETVYRSNLNYVFSVFLKNISTVSVDCYILITGYFLCKSKCHFEKVLTVYLQLFYYSIFFLLLNLIWPITPNVSRISLFLHSIFPFTTMQYWFVSSYLALLFFSPFLNALIGIMDKRQFLFLLVGLSFVTSVMPSLGLDIFSFNRLAKPMLFILLYFVGAYCRCWVDLTRARGRFFLAAYLLLTALNFMLLLANLVSMRTHNICLFHCEDFLFVLTCAAATALFLWFGCLKIASPRFGRIILFFAPLTFGVYLFHENPYFMGFLWHRIVRIQNFFNSDWYPVIGIGAIIGIYLAGSGFDWIRQEIFLELRIRDRLRATTLCRFVNTVFNSNPDAIYHKKDES